MRRLIFTTVLVALCCGCLDRFDEHSAYEGMELLCDQQALDEDLAACRTRQGEGCRGIVSVEGTLEGVAILLTTEADSVTLTLLATDFKKKTDPVIVEPGTQGMVDSVRISAKGPYFHLLLSLEDLDGFLPETPIDAPRTWLVFPGKGKSLLDNAATMQLRLTGAGESREFTASTGLMVFGRRSSDQLLGSFEVRFEQPADRLQGCFDVLFDEEVKYKIY